MNELSIRKLLDCLMDGQIHSGQSLGEALGVSRAAVWKQVQQLEQLGLSLKKHKGQGYQLPVGIELLNESRIREQLAASLSAKDLRIETFF